MTTNFNSQQCSYYGAKFYDHPIWSYSVLSSLNCTFFTFTDSQIHDIPLYVLYDRELLAKVCTGYYQDILNSILKHIRIMHLSHIKSLPHSFPPNTHKEL